MALSEKAKREMLYGGFAAIIGTILWLSRNKPAVAQSAGVSPTVNGVVTSPAPDYVTYNVPKIPSISGWTPPTDSIAQQTSAGSSIPVPNSQGTCINCNDINTTGGLAYSLNSALQGLVNSVNNFSEQYTDSLESAFPSQFSQFINNPAAATAEQNYNENLGANQSETF